MASGAGRGAAGAAARGGACLVLLAVLGAFCARNVPRIDDVPHRSVSEADDEALFLDIAKHFRAGSPFPKSSMREYAENEGFYMRVPPLFPKMTSLSFRLFGERLRAARAVSLLFAILAIVWTFWLGARLAGPIAGAAASVLLALSPVFNLYAVTGVLDAAYVSFALLAILFADRFLESGRTRDLIAAAAALGVATSVKQIGLIAAAALLAALVIRDLRVDGDRVSLSRRTLRSAAIAAGVCAAVFVGLCLPALSRHPLLALKQMLWLEFVTKTVGALKGDMAPRGDTFQALDGILFVAGFAAAVLLQRRRLPRLAAPAFVGVAFLPGFAFASAPHYTLSLAPLSAAFVAAAIVVFISPRGRTATPGGPPPCG